MTEERPVRTGNQLTPAEREALERLEQASVDMADCIRATAHLIQAPIDWLGMNRVMSQVRGQELSEAELDTLLAPFNPEYDVEAALCSKASKERAELVDSLKIPEGIRHGCQILLETYPYMEMMTEQRKSSALANLHITLLEEDPGKEARSENCRSFAARYRRYCRDFWHRRCGSA